ncbi:uncharacterized protein TRAVEDRAFT_57554 [Trametes versicolor FP-101664 SS1]|uniref:uncharacterized protein n=1 Tax=Trametes versicolor (strain FP-101664) TaxID=717944 RepID=UPI0004624264|nr:uncharacterized protein TRAVEDRAFT_57554 [Trametes versicolor FP-101664 SS1]EIW60229.1 hypothetical protein TRAVEDRAFT_57554 [Trametes versicolor FP-101664 SS1]
MASSAVKARISAFESMQSSSATIVPKSPPNLLESPISPTATSISPMVPSPSATAFKPTAPSPSPSPPNLGRKTSLIDLKEWVVPDGPLPYVPRQRPPITRKPPPPLVTKPVTRHVSDSMVTRVPTPLIHLESPPKTRAAPPLPPRKPSYSSLRSVSASNSSSSSLPRSPSQPTPPLPIPSRSDSLTVDHTYPPLSKLGIGSSSRHAPASSISSFHSVSLSSDGGTDPATPGSLSNHVATYPMDHDDHELEHDSIHEPDPVSLDESFENLSVTSAVSPSASSVSHDWEVYATKRAPEPPKLPQRPSKPPSLPTSPRHSPLLAPKRDGPPPPPPPRSRPPSSRNSLASTSAASTSDRSSILSIATSRTSISTRSTTTPKPKAAQLARPTPVPPAARKRYETVFNGNVIAARQAERTKSPPRKARQAAGWRGLSVDLITNPEEIASAPPSRSASVDEEVGADERLEGTVVRAIWKLSRLKRETLRVIWIECDPSGTGSLDRDAFVKGMWRIDEELRKAQMHQHLSPRMYLRQPKPTHPPRPILR